ncbi:MAG: GAF domain-containing protein [Anaerolineae bacterium]
MPEEPLSILLLVEEPREREAILLTLRRLFPNLRIQQSGDFEHSGIHADEKFDLALVEASSLSSLELSSFSGPLILLREDAAPLDVPKRISFHVVDKSPQGLEQLPMLISDLMNIEEDDGTGGAVQLQESEAKYQALFEASTSAIFLETVDGRILDCNAAACRLYGYEKEELVGLHVRDIIPEELAETIPEVIEEELATGRYISEAIGKRKDGTLFPTEVSTLLLTIGGEKAVVAYVRDLSEEKAAREALEEREETLRTLMGNLPGMVYRCRYDPNWSMEFVSVGCFDLTGYAPDDLLNNRRISYVDLIHPDDQKMVSDRIREAVEKNAIFRLAYRIITADEKMKWVWEQGRAVRSPTGEVLALEGIITDITARREIEERVRLQAAALGAIENGVIILDREGRVIWVNPAFNRLSGYISEDLVGRDLSVLRFREHVSEDLYSQLRDALRGGYAWRGEMINVREGRKRYIAEVTLTPVSDFEGEVTHFIALFRDITERRAQEEEIARLAKFPSENPHPVLRVNREGIISYANDASEPLLQHWGCQQSEELPEVWRRIVLFVHTANRSQTMEVRVGKQTLSLTLTPIADADYVNIYGRDISDRIAVEEEKRRRQTRLRRQHEILIRLSTDPFLGGKDLEEALTLICTATTEALNVERVNIWQVTQKPSGMRCLAQCGDPVGAGCLGERVTQEVLKDYFNALEQGLVVVAPDASIDFRTTYLYDNFWKPRGVAAVLNAPVRLHGKMVGVVCLEHVDSIRNWTSDEITFARQIADLVAQVFSNADLRRRTEDLMAITRVSREVALASDLRDVLSSIARHAVELSGADGGVVFTLDSDEAPVVVGYGSSAPLVEYIRSGQDLTDPNSVIGRALARRRIVAFSDIEHEDQSVSAGLHFAENLRAVSLLPMYKGDDLVGGIIVARHKPHDFTHQEVAFLEALAQQFVNAVENARLLESLRQEKGHLELLYRLAHHVTEPLSLQEVARRSLEDLRTAMGAEQGVILLYDSDSRRMQLVADSGYEAFDDALGERYLGRHLRGGLINWVVAHREPALLSDLMQDISWQRSGTEEAGERSALVVPLIGGEDLLGVLGLYVERPAAFDVEHVRLAESAAATIAIAIANVQLFDDLRFLLRSEHEKREFAEALEEAAFIVNTNPDPDEVLDRILEQVERVVEGDTFNIMLFDGDEVRVARRRGYEELSGDVSLSPPAFLISRYPNLARMVRTGEPIVVSDTVECENWITPATGKEWRRSYVGAPIRIGDATVGFLNVNSTQTGKFGPEDGRRLKAFAAHAATAIQNARLFQALHDYAEELESRVAERTMELQDQYVQLEAVLRSTSDGIVVATTDGDIQQVNPIVDLWLTRELTQKGAERFRDAVRDLSRRAVERPELVLELQRLDLELRAAPIPAMAGQEGRVVIAIHDISHLKALERMKSQFISDVSHELRTPITTIRLYAQLLRKSPPSKWEEYLEALEVEIERQAQLIQEILQFSRIDAQRLDLDLQVVDLNELVESTLSSQILFAQDKGVTLEFHPGQRVPELWGDAQKLRQVMLNLIINALRYTSTGGEVSVRTGWAEIEGRAWATVEVSDTGLGIPPEELPHIFERFYRGNKPRELQIPGTGLGLAIAKEIVDLHNGWITVETEPDEGSTFTVWLPPRHAGTSAESQIAK